MPRIDSPRNLRYRLEVDGIPWARFSEVQLGERPIDAVDGREKTDPLRVRKLPGLRKFANITLKRGRSVGESAPHLFRWRADVSSGHVKARRKRVVIVLLDEAGADTVRIVVSGAWPVKYDPSDLDAKGNEVSIELLELANEGIERVE